MLSTILASAIAGAVATAPSPTGDQSRSATTPDRFDLLGVQVCIGGPGDAQPCHLRLFPAPPKRAIAEKSATRPVPVQVSAFGKTVCLGPVPEHATCDLRIGSSDEDSPTEA